MNLFVVISLLSILIYIFCFLLARPKVWRNGKLLRYPPNTLPLLGNGIIFLEDRNKLFSWFVKCERLFGFETFAIIIPSLPPGVVINDPSNLAFVLRNESVFAKGDFFKKKSHDLLGNGIINSDGTLWKLQRRAGIKFLSIANLKVLAEQALPIYLKEAVKVLKHSDNSVVDLNEIFHEITTQLMGKMAYNMEIHHRDPFSADFDYASEVTMSRFPNPFWRIKEFFFGSQFRKAKSDLASFGALIVSEVQSRRNKKFPLTLEDSLESASGSLISLLLDVIEDKKVVADAALSFLTAGRDSTGQSLAWTFYLLMKHPSQMEAARSHIMEVMEQNSLQVLEVESLDTSIFQPSRFPFIMAIFYEALRLFPPVPVELKQCQQPTTLPDGTELLKGYIVCWCSWAINRSQLIWGDDAEKFKPERWLVDGIFTSRSAFEFPVFNGGTRMCLGKKMAEMIAVQVIATLVLGFDFELLDHRERLSKNSLTLPMVGGLQCRVKVRG